MATADYKIRIMVESIVGDAKRKLGGVTQSTNLLNTTTKGLVGTLAKASLGFASVTGAIIAFDKIMKESTKTAISFNRELANVATLIPGQVKRINELKESVKLLSIESGKSLTDLTGGLYQVISAFGDAADTEEKLNIVTKAAIAGQSSTTASLNLLSAVTKAYGDTSATALKKVSDLAFETVRLGQTTFPELASSMQQVTAIAKSLGVTQEELFTSYATLTGVTGSASEVSTQLRGAMTALMGPSESLQKLYDKLGVSSGKAFIQQEGFQGALAEVIKYAEETGTSLQDLLGRQKAIIGATALGSAQAEVYARKFGEIAVASKSTDKAFDEVSKGINKQGFELKQLSAQWKVLQSQIGDKVLKATGNLIPSLTNLFGKLSGNRDITDDMSDSLSELIIMSDNYKKIVNDLETDQSSLSEVEKTLLDIRKEQAALDIREKLDEVSDGYAKTENRIKKYNDIVTEQTKRQEHAQEVIDKFKSDGLVKQVENATEATWSNAEGVTELSERYTEYTDAQTILINSNKELIKAGLKLDEIESNKKHTIALVAQAVLDGSVNIDAYRYSNIALYNEIITVVAALREQKTAQAGLNSEQGEYSVNVAQAMKAYIGYSSEQLKTEINILKNKKMYTREVSSVAFLTNLINSLELQALVTKNKEVEIAKKYTEQALKAYETQLFQLTAGKGLVKIERERARAIEDAKNNYVDSADVVEAINKLYNEQAKQFVKSLSDQLSYNLAIASTESEIRRIEIERNKALKDLADSGIINKDIIEDTNELYDIQKQKILDSAEVMWKAKLFSLRSYDDERQIEIERTKAIEESNKKYGYQKDLIDDINKIYDSRLSNFIKQESLLAKIDKAGKNIIGDKAYKNLKDIQLGVKKISDAWNQMQPIVESITDAYGAYLDTQDLIREREIENLEEDLSNRESAKDKKIALLEAEKSERLDALKKMYDADTISYAEYQAKKLEIDKKFETDKKEASKEYIKALNELKMEQY